MSNYSIEACNKKADNLSKIVTGLKNVALGATVVFDAEGNEVDMQPGDLQNESGKTILQIDDLSGAITFAVAYYSTAAQLTAYIKSEYSTVASNRKIAEAEIYMSLKNNAPEGKKGTSSDAKIMAMIQNKGMQTKENKWNELLIKMTALTDALSKFIDMLKGLMYQRNAESKYVH